MVAPMTMRMMLSNLGFSGLVLLLSLLLACGGEESNETETEDETSENAEEGESEGEETAEAEGDEGDEGDEDLGEEEEPDELAIEVEELTPDQETRDRVAPETRGIAHILVRYRGASRAPSSITRSQAEAETRAQDVLSRVEGGADFAELANEMSDDMANHDHGGSMGALEQGLLPGPLDTALFAMDVGDVRLVETDLGFHVVKRTE